MKNKKKLVQLTKIELDSIEKLTIVTSLKSDAKRIAELVEETKNEYFAEKLERQKDLYKKFTGRDMNLTDSLGEL